MRELRDLVTIAAVLASSFLTTAAPAFAGGEDAPSIVRVEQTVNGPCPWLFNPVIDVSKFDLLPDVRRVLLTSQAPPQRISPLGSLPGPSKVLDSDGMADEAAPIEHGTSVKVSEIRGENGKPKVTLVSSSTRNTENLETMGRGYIAIHNLVQLFGSADIMSMQATANGTADIDMFRVPLGRGVNVIAFSRTQVYLSHTGDLLGVGTWGSGGLGTGVGVGLQVPGPVSHHPLQIAVGGGPMLLWGGPLPDKGGPQISGAQVSGTVLGSVELLAF